MMNPPVMFVLVRPAYTESNNPANIYHGFIVITPTLIHKVCISLLPLYKTKVYTHDYNQYK
jgi:hypothetical protein